MAREQPGTATPATSVDTQIARRPATDWVSAARARVVEIEALLADQSALRAELAHLQRMLRPIDQPVRGGRWTAEEDRQLLALDEQGMPCRQIAKTLGRRQQPVGLRLGQLRRKAQVTR